jgi:hypothetical protein
MKKQHAIFDTEIIGLENPVFLVCVKIKETGEKFSFWGHQKSDLKKLLALLQNPDLTWVGFNSINFDQPLINAALCEYDVHTLKEIAQAIIAQNLKPWHIQRQWPMQPLLFDHIDLMEVAPGVLISLKTYAARMHSPKLVDLPYPHDRDLKTYEMGVLRRYCFNDIEETDRLHTLLKDAIELREHLGEHYNLDLRSKSNPQVAETIIKKVCNFNNRDAVPHTSAIYNAPELIAPQSTELKFLVRRIEGHQYLLDGRGAPIEPEWMKESFNFRAGKYKVGLGGLHSQHDRCKLVEADKNWALSDFDVTSYYPNILIKCGLIPKMPGNKGELFIETYKDLYVQRVAAKKAGDKHTADSLKISLNGLFGKIGSPYCVFYDPDLLIAITLTGQLNLLCMIEALTSIPQVSIVSANTDGLMVRYPRVKRSRVLKAFAANSRRTGFEWEETPYRKIAAKDVNNYIAVKEDGQVKAKGLYSESGVLEMKNPTCQICSTAATRYLQDGTPPQQTVEECQDIRQFLSVRTVQGGGEQGGKPFGRIARWYMSRQMLPAPRYIESGNKVAKSEGGRICLTLPEQLPKDLDKVWYIKEAHRILNDVGVLISDYL